MVVFPILIFLPFYPSLKRTDSLFEKLWKYIFSSLLMTSSVMLGTLPLISATYAKLSLETFWLKKVMFPLLGTLILPLCLMSLWMSFINLGSPPFMLLESEIFKLTEWSIRVWFSIMEELHQIGGWAVIKGRLEWSKNEYTIYYPIVLILGYGVIF